MDINTILSDFFLKKKFLYGTGKGKDNIIISDIALGKSMNIKSNDDDSNVVSIFLYLPGHRAVVGYDFRQVLLNYDTGNIIKDFGKGKIHSVNKKYNFIIFLNSESSPSKGISDFDGNVVLPPVYENIFIDEEKDLIVTKSQYGQISVMDIKGNVIAKDNMTVTKDGNSLGVVNSDGKVILEPSFKDIYIDDIKKIIIATYYFNNDEIPLRRVVDFNGKFIFEGRVNNILELQSEGAGFDEIARLFIEKPELLLSSKEVKDIHYEVLLSGEGKHNWKFIKGEDSKKRIFSMNDSLYFGIRNDDGKTMIVYEKFVDKESKFLLAFDGKRARKVLGPVTSMDISGDIVIYQKQGSHGSIYGIADLYGKTLFETSDLVIDRKEADNIVSMSKNWKFGMIDYHGNVIIEPKYDFIRYIKAIDGFILVEDMSQKDIGKSTLVDRKGNVMLSADYIDFYNPNSLDEYMYIIQKDKRGVMETNSKKWIMPLIRGFDYVYTNAHDYGDFFMFDFVSPRDSFSFTLDVKSREIIGSFYNNPNMNSIDLLLIGSLLLNQDAHGKEKANVKKEMQDGR